MKNAWVRKMKEVIQESCLNTALTLPNTGLYPLPKSPMKVKPSGYNRTSRFVPFYPTSLFNFHPFEAKTVSLSLPLSGKYFEKAIYFKELLLLLGGYVCMRYMVSSYYVVLYTYCALQRENLFDRLTHVDSVRSISMPN